MNENPTTVLETKYGYFDLMYFEYYGTVGVVMSRGDVSTGVPLLRIHSSCLFSEALCAVDCDCKLQLNAAIREIAKRDHGIVVYLYQEGRGVGLKNKFRAVEVMRTQDCDTAEAFEYLNFELDPRDYRPVIAALEVLGTAKQIRLMTNNPRKYAALVDAGYNVVETVKLAYSVNQRTMKYLKSKESKLGHAISWSAVTSAKE